MGFNLAFKGLITKLNPICHLLALLEAHYILRVSRIRVNAEVRNIRSKFQFLCSYVGESKIIRTISFAVGYTAGWAWQNTHGLLLSYHCGKGVNLTVHLSWVFCHKHGHSQFHLHQRRAGGSDPFLWAEGVPGVKMHRMMSLQYGNSVMSQRIVC